MSTHLMSDTPNLLKKFDRFSHEKRKEEEKKKCFGPENS